MHRQYPNDLVVELDKINDSFFQQFKDSFLPNDSLFMTKSISQIILEYLNKNGHSTIKELPKDWNLTIDYLIAHLKSHTNIELQELRQITNQALGHAYDEKYLNRSYVDDVRGNYDQWISSFNSILTELNVDSLSNLSTLVVGSGNGLEGTYLYSGIKDLTIVDIAPKSLEKAKELLRPKEAYVLNAQNLDKISSSSIKAYISLLTYQSSYFDIGKALVEAYRVLQKDGIIIISVACGFMKDDHIYIDGLIDPRTSSLDRNRPYEIISEIRRKLIFFSFLSMGIKTTPSEIFIYARKSV